MKRDQSQQKPGANLFVGVIVSTFTNKGADRDGQPTLQRQRNPFQEVSQGFWLE